MKTLKLAFLLLGVLAAAACNTSLNGPNNSNQDDDFAGASSFLVNKQIASFQAAGVDVNGVEAFFSVGWSPHYDEDADNAPMDALFSDAFAIALQNAGGDIEMATGLDMGAVTLHYPSSSIELLKSQYDDFGCFYDLYGEDFDDDDAASFEQNQVPFTPGAVYRFEATGAGEFAPISLELAAPSRAVQITNPESDPALPHDQTQPLTVTWEAWEGSDSLMIYVFPFFDDDYGDEDCEDDDDGDHDSDDDDDYEDDDDDDEEYGEYGENGHHLDDEFEDLGEPFMVCLLYTSPSPRDPE